MTYFSLSINNKIKGCDQVLYKEWLVDWLGNYVSPSVKPRTYERYLEIVRNRLIIKLGNYDVKDLTPLIIQKYITELMQNGNMKTGRGLSSNSVNTVIAVIQNSMSIAFDIGITDEYVMDKLKRPKIQEKKITCFSPAEQKVIEQAVINDKRSKMFGIVLCLYTGLRIGELLALEWKDIDFLNHEISVDKTCYDGKNKDGIYCRFTSVPKTDTSNRVIPIPKQLIPVLRNLKRKSSSEYVISDGDKTISVRSYQRSFELLLKKLNIQHRGFHSLRHTFATRALECGIDVKTLSEILGHKNPTVTLHRYAHSMMEHKKEMMDRLGKLF